MLEPSKEPAPAERPRPGEGQSPPPQRKPYSPPKLIEYGSLTTLTQGIHSRNRDHFAGRVLGS